MPWSLCYVVVGTRWISALLSATRLSRRCRRQRCDRGHERKPDPEAVVASAVVEAGQGQEQALDGVGLDHRPGVDDRRREAAAASWILQHNKVGARLYSQHGFHFTGEQVAIPRDADTIELRTGKFLNVRHYQ